MLGTFGQSNSPGDSERQAFKSFLLSAERSEEETRSFMDANFTNGIAEHLIPSAFREKAIDAYEAAGASVPRRPGFGLLLDAEVEDEDGAFPRLSFGADDEGSWRAHTLLIREICILRVVEELTNKPEWWLKVKDDEIAGKWKTEVLQMDWKTLVGLWAVFTEGMADAVIAELRAKADLYEETGLIPVMDYSACAIKSDRLMSDDLVQRLKAAVAPLENVPDNVKDWHPGSDGKVLDLVHPSLWPLVYGRTRVLPDKTIGVADCLKHAGTGVTLPTLEPRRDKDQQQQRRRNHDDDIELSAHYQWLPCDVTLKDGKATVASYINNLHPVQHASLYPVIEEFINLALPAWDLVYRWPTEFAFKRMHWEEIYKWDCAAPDFCRGKCDPLRCPLSEGGVPGPSEDDDAAGSDDADDFDEEAYYDMQRGDAREQWFARHHTMVLPDPASDTYCDNFAASEIMPSSPSDLFGSNDGGDSPTTTTTTLQVIVKLASIHLTPDRPSYGGGAWHVEGQRNEHIIATALFYYDADNVTDSALAFRTAANGEELDAETFYEQNDALGIERALAIRARGSVLQDVGQVSTRPGRALFFPNLYQHRVSPFALADPARPGHRKILALFLVDPKVPVLSTANVPPQQRPWWEHEVGGGGGGGDGGDGLVEGGVARRGLPNELRKMVMDGIDFPISLAEAKKIREDLMAERKVLVQDSQSKWDQTEFNFCEH